MKTNIATNSILLFVALTIGYGFFKSLLIFMQPSETIGDNFFIKNFEYVALGLYIFTTFGIQLITNISSAKKICKDSSQKITNVLLYTLFPYVIIFVSIICFINIFPGWLRPFSNTFGYAFAMFLSVKSVFTELLKTQGDNPLLGQIYSDKSMIINEMSPDNYDDFMANLKGSGILKQNVKDLSEYVDLKNIIKIKNIVAEVIWYILAGVLSITVSNSIIMNYKCEYDIATMKKMHKELDDKEAELQKKANENTQTTSTGVTTIPTATD